MHIFYLLTAKNSGFFKRSGAPAAAKLKLLNSKPQNKARHAQGPLASTRQANAQREKLKDEPLRKGPPRAYHRPSRRPEDSSALRYLSSSHTSCLSSWCSALLRCLLLLLSVAPVFKMRTLTVTMASATQSLQATVGGRARELNHCERFPPSPTPTTGMSAGLSTFTCEQNEVCHVVFCRGLSSRQRCPVCC